MMRIYTVDGSSIIKRVAYCDFCKVLVVKFIKGGVYRYKNVPYDVYQDIINTEEEGSSVGSYFHKNIKGNYDSDCIVDSSNTTATTRYNMEHACICNEVPSQEKLFGELFGKVKAEKSSSKIETVVQYKVNGKLYNTVQEANEALKTDFDIQLDRLLIEVPDESCLIIKDFIMNNRDELKKILQNIS